MPCYNQVTLGRDAAKEGKKSPRPTKRALGPSPSSSGLGRDYADPGKNPPRRGLKWDVLGPNMRKY